MALFGGITKIRIVFTGGGTGGHIFPLLAVAEELSIIAREKNLELELTYMGPTTGPFSFDERIFEEKGIRVVGISSESPDNNDNVLAKLFSLVKVGLGLLQTLWHLWLIMPDAVFSKGGYGAVPVLLTSAAYRIPILIHESDVIPGKINEFGKNFALKIAISFEKTIEFFPFEKTAFTGNPIRKAFFEPGNKEESLKSFGFSPNKKTIFVYGGSQGAKKLNDLVLAMLPKTITEYQVIHQCGTKNYPEISRESEFLLRGQSRENRAQYRLYGFMNEEEIKQAYSACDLVVSRAGSGSIFEIASFGKPSILIPLSTAARDHQRENAYAFAKNGASVVYEENNLKSNLFYEGLNRLFNNPSKMEQMSLLAKEFAKPKAGAVIAKELLSISGATSNVAAASDSGAKA